MTRSVLDDLGEEITGIVAPVSICMLLVVVLVKALNPDGMSDSSTVAIATIAYHEKVWTVAGINQLAPMPTTKQRSDPSNSPAGNRCSNVLQQRVIAPAVALILACCHHSAICMVPA